MNSRQPVTGLAAADFELTDNGVRQTVDAVSLEHNPIDVTLLLTALPAMRTDEQRRGFVSAEATRKLLLPADRLRVVRVDDEIGGAVAASDYTVTTDTPLRAPPGAIALLDGNRAFWHLGFGVALVDGLFYALAWPGDADRRHLVAAFTDACNTASTLDVNMLPKLAAHSDAVLHAVFWATPDDRTSTCEGLPPHAPSPAWQASYRAIDEAVQRTGGTLQLAKPAPNALAEIIADFRSSYVLRYTPHGVTPAGWHELKVKVTRGSYTIRARKGYEGG